MGNPMHVPALRKDYSIILIIGVDVLGDVSQAS